MFACLSAITKVLYALHLYSVANCYCEVLTTVVLTVFILILERGGSTIVSAFVLVKILY